MHRTSSRRPPAKLATPLVALLIVLAACTAQPVPPISPSPTMPLTAAPTATVAPTPTTAPSPTLSPPPTASPSPTPTATASPPPTLSPTPSPSASATTNPASPLAEQLAARLRSSLTDQRTGRLIPGAAGAVIFPDGSIWADASGNADTDPQRAATAETPFVVGSVTKTFVAALIMQLAEEGALDLDDKLDEWLPDYPRAGQISLRHLLAHTSGVYNYFDHPSYNGRVFGDRGHEWTPQEILDEFVGPPYFAPGTGYHYSNTGFILLGMVAEEVTGNTLGEEFETRFFVPLGLADTHFQGSGPPDPDAAQGYLRTEAGLREVADVSGYRPTRSAATVAWAAGGMLASAPDIARWAEALYGGDLLTPESLAELTDHQASPYGDGMYALGTRTRLILNRRAFGHTGSLRGFQAAVWHIPDSGLTVAVLHNRGRIDANPMADALAAIALPSAEAYSAP